MIESTKFVLFTYWYFIFKLLFTVSRYDAEKITILQPGFNNLVLKVWPLPQFWAGFYQDSANVSIVF